jgi:hypothetical protein
MTPGLGEGCQGRDADAALEFDAIAARGFVRAAF